MGVARARASQFVCIGCFAAFPAVAGTPERDKAWNALIGQAKAHGGVERKLDRSASFVFQRPDGSYLTLTQPLPTAGDRSVCLIVRDENATACVAWDTGKLTLGSRADPATPWRFRSAASLEAFEAEQPGLLQKMLSALQGLLPSGKRTHGSGEGGYWRYRDGDMVWVKSTPN